MLLHLTSSLRRKSRQQLSPRFAPSWQRVSVCDALQACDDGWKELVVQGTLLYILIQLSSYHNENIAQFCRSKTKCNAKKNFLGFHTHNTLSNADSCSRCAKRCVLKGTQKILLNAHSIRASLESAICRYNDHWRGPEHVAHILRQWCIKHVLKPIKIS